MAKLFSKQTAVGAWLGISNKILCSLTGQEAEKSQEFKFLDVKKNVAGTPKQKLNQLYLLLQVNIGSPKLFEDSNFDLPFLMPLKKHVRISF